ncbi:LOW QUALITY PROTEIN: hypothetical protein PHMEG_0006658 [Phytophthora megakarya]|uniref:Eukaryotic/viral aspartic protease n=1 Tax=Phytophthora megakarya TaxID=4795 RepID=A0A225WQ62_9STRA|nr:LOW QUALITY PROTEIN: hypothetical protein PHMEG_0006658 [Phytophthora megakarya]
MSVAWQYYHSRKRSGETPLDYFYRLNVDVLRVKLTIKTETQKRAGDTSTNTSKRDPEVADRLTLLQLADLDEREEVLRARPRVGNADSRSSQNFDRKSHPALQLRQPVPWYVQSKRKIRAPSQKGSQDLTDPTRKANDELRRIFLAGEEDNLIGTGGVAQNPDPGRSRTNAPEGGRIPERRTPGDRDHEDRDRCSHCGPGTTPI